MIPSGVYYHGGLCKSQECLELYPTFSNTPWRVQTQAAARLTISSLLCCLGRLLAYLILAFVPFKSNIVVLHSLPIQKGSSSLRRFFAELPGNTEAFACLCKLTFTAGPKAWHGATRPAPSHFVPPAGLSPLTRANTLRTKTVREVCYRFPPSLNGQH